MKKLLLFVPMLALASCKFNENGNKMILPADPNATEQHQAIEEIYQENKTEQDQLVIAQDSMQEVPALADSLSIDSTQFHNADTAE